MARKAKRDSERIPPDQQGPLMAFKLEVGIPREDGKISIMHTFYGETKAECVALKKAHADVCPNFGPAVKAGDVTELCEEIDEDEWPSTGEDDDDDETDGAINGG